MIIYKMSDQTPKEKHTLIIPAGTILLRAGNTSNNREGAPWKYFSYWRSDDDSKTQIDVFKKNFIQYNDMFSSRISPERKGEFEFWMLKKDAPLLYVPYTIVTLDTDDPYTISVSKYLIDNIDKLGIDKLNNEFFKMHVHGRKAETIDEMSSEDVKNCYKFVVRTLIEGADESDFDERCDQISDSPLVDDYAIVKISLVLGYPGMVRFGSLSTVSKDDEIAIGASFIDEYLERIDVTSSKLKKILSEELCNLIEKVNKRHSPINFSDVLDVLAEPKKEEPKEEEQVGGMRAIYKNNKNNYKKLKGIRNL
jgi:hypothetical protein